MKAILSVGLTSIHNLPNQIHHGSPVRSGTVNLGVDTNPFSRRGKTKYPLDKHTSIPKCQECGLTFLHS